MEPTHTPAEQRVLAKITPIRALPSIVSTTLQQVDASLKQMQIPARAVLGGSTAKNTYLAGDFDIDVFVRFQASYDESLLSKTLEHVLQKTFTKVERVHGSRDYFHVMRGKYTFEFIPVLDISDWRDARNVTDMSPLHVDYVAKHVQQRPWLSAEIRLTKQFCKAAKIYGAESYIGGFSGHVIDLLNIHYGGFHALLSAAANWTSKTIIDPEQHLTSPLHQLNAAKVTSPLIIVDPVQPDRNSAAALSKKAYDLFKLTAAKYLNAKEREKEQFFKVTGLDIREFARLHTGNDIFVIEMIPCRGKKDVVGAKCRKIYEYCIKQILDAGFVITASTWEFTPQKVLIAFAAKAMVLPMHQDIVGPPIHRTHDVAKFKTVHKTTFSREGRMHAVESRPFREVRTLLETVIKSPYVTQRVTKIKLKSTSGPKNAAKQLNKHL